MLKIFTSEMFTGKSGGYILVLKSEKPFQVNSDLEELGEPRRPPIFE